MKPLILASTSRYRRELLERLRIPFQVIAPGIDEQQHPRESPRRLAERLAREKAQSVRGSPAIVIGSDQVASVDGRLLRKPGSHAAALEQLLLCQGQAVLFQTAVAISDATEQTLWEHVDETRVCFGQHDADRLSRYLEREQPYDCAGGFKAEGLGITLFESIESRDPTALLGLPLIWVAAMLRRAGLDPLGPD